MFNGSEKLMQVAMLLRKWQHVHMILLLLNIGVQDHPLSSTSLYDMFFSPYYFTCQNTCWSYQIFYFDAPILNFKVSDYEKELEVMNTMSQDEFVAYVRR